MSPVLVLGTNVCVCRFGHLKLGDFGSAARLGPGGVVRTPAPVGTPHYIAPELLRALEDPKNHPHGVCSILYFIQYYFGMFLTI